MAYTQAAVSSILIGPCEVYRAPADTAEPLTTVLAGALTTPWTLVGLTVDMNPVVLAIPIEEHIIKAQQFLSALAVVRVSLEATIEIALLEMTADNLAVAFGGTVATVVSGAAQPAAESLTIEGNSRPTNYAWVIEGTFPYSTTVTLPVRFYIKRAPASFNGKFEFNKRPESFIPLKINCLADPTTTLGALLKFRKLTAPATP